MSEETLVSCFCNLGCDVPDKLVVDKCKLRIKSTICNVEMIIVSYLMCTY